MAPERALLQRLLQASGYRLALAALLAMLAAMSAVGLVASAGWLITASALAGLAGVGLEIFFPGAIVRALAVSRTLTRYCERLLGHAAIFDALVRLRGAVFSALARLPLSRLAKRSNSVDLRRLMQDVEQLEGWPVKLVLPLLGLAASTGLVIGLVAVAIGAWAMLGTLCVLAAVCLSVLAWPRATRRMAIREALLRQRHAQRLADLLSARRHLWHVDPQRRSEAGLRQLFARQAAQLIRLERQVQRREALQQLLLGVLALLLLGMANASPAWQLLAVLAVVAYAGVVPGVTGAWARFPGLWVAARATLAEPPGSAATPRHLPPPSIAPLLQFENVRVESGWAEPPLFDQFDWSIKPGEHWAVCGPSGSGKSTLARLLASSQLAQRGRVLIDGESADALSDSDRLNRLAFLSQQTVILADSLRANLTLGCQRAVDDQALQQALAAVGLEALTGELDRWLGETGQPLSGGQARRVALIRCVLTDAPGLVLDEPFRGLDAKSREATEAWLRAQARGKTLLLLDHAPPPHWPGQVRNLNLARTWGD
jgi:ATP-binding cassette subfamily C protein CydC